ncbi:MAG TPA: serine peptidase [Alphaproteobacteria bacterium]|nr:serine peptidase [Alphaproteobacteria bacterium]HAJ46611.1 serine peptidase [Alphaproteobacteria bacterium]
MTWSGGGPAAWAEYLTNPSAAPSASPESLKPRQFAGLESSAPVLAMGPAFGGGTIQSMADLVDHVMPSVVSVKVSVQGKDMDEVLRNSPFRDFFGLPGPGGRSAPRPRSEVQGSGFIVDETGYVVTNNHVIDEGRDIEVVLPNEKTLKAKLVGRDQATDIALLKIETKEKLPAVTFADDKKVRVGDWVLAVGNPFGLGGTVTAGIVSARGRDVGDGPYTQYLQIDAAINRGNSGGPTFDMRGHVVGMNTAIYSPTGGSVGIGFAIPASTIQSVIKDLRSTGQVSRGWLGVQIQTLTEDLAESEGLPRNQKGAMIAAVLPGSPAEKAGFQERDVVIKINGEVIESNRDMTRKVATLPNGSTATFTILRGGKERTLNATVGKRDSEEKVSGLFGRGGRDTEEPSKLADLGIGVAPVTASTKRQFRLDEGAEGLVITSVDPNSDAAEKGLRPGLRIVGIGQDKVENRADLDEGIERAQKAGRSTVLLKVEGDRGASYVAVRIDNE